MLIKNINGTSQNKCGCGSWLDHWKNFSGQPLPGHCSEVRCYNAPELGAHIQLNSVYDNNWYIVPLCQEHNQANGPIEVNDITSLVSANINETCGKKNIW